MIGQPENIRFHTSFPAGTPTYQQNLFAAESGSPGYWVGRYGKPGPVIEVETPETEEEIRSSYPVESATFVRRYAGAEPLLGSFPNVGKPAGLIQVYHPGVEQEIRDMYPADHPVFVRVWQGDPPLVGLGQEPKPPRLKPTAIPIAVITLGVGLIVGIAGFINRTKPLGQLALGTGGSMMGTSLVLLIRDLVE